MDRKNHNWLPVFAVLLSICIPVKAAYGSGFAIFTHGASPLGQAAAVTAHADNPDTVFYNPALMNKLDGTQMELGTTLIIPSREFKSTATGMTFETDSEVFFPSTFYVTHKFNEKISGGLGVFNPFGLSTDWGKDWEGRYIATRSELRTYTINPAVSVQISPAVSVAFGLDYLLLDAELEKRMNFAPLLPDGNQKFEGDGDGIGYNLGIAISPNDDITFGASYRSKIGVDIDGNARFNVPIAAAVFFPDTGGNADLDLPAQAFAGVHYRGFSPLTFEVGLRWEDWSSFDELKINLDKPVGPPGNTTQEVVTPRDWDNTLSANIGVKYQLNEAIALLGGYLYSDNPVPDDTFEPAIPDSDTHLFTVGTAFSFNEFTLDLAYGYQYLEKRDKNNAIGDPLNPLPLTSANGTYESDIHMLAFSLTYRF